MFDKTMLASSAVIGGWRSCDLSAVWAVLAEGRWELIGKSRGMMGEIKSTARQGER